MSAEPLQYEHTRLPKLPNPKPNKYTKGGWLKVKRPTFKKFSANYSGLTPRCIQKQTSSVKLAIISYREKDIISYRSSPICRSLLGVSLKRGHLFQQAGGLIFVQYMTNRVKIFTNWQDFRISKSNPK